MGEPAAELRVHGVGGSTGAKLLGLENEHEPIVVTQGDRTYFAKRGGAPHIEGYVWGGLTTDSRLQPLWLLLLPFSMLNVAGWMHEPVGTMKEWRVVWTRVFTFLLGFTLTATYVLWLTAIIVNDVGYVWIHKNFKTIEPRTGVLIGVDALALLALLTALFAQRTRGGEKHVETFLGFTPNTTRGSWWRGLAKHEELTHPGFFNRAQDSENLLNWHLGFAALLILTLGGLAFASASKPAHAFQLPHYLEIALIATGAVQFALLLALTAVSRRRAANTIGFHSAGPAVVATLAIAIANAMLAGLARVVESRLKLKPGDQFLLADVLVYTLLAAVVFALIWAVKWHVFPARLGDVSDVPHNNAGPGTPMNGATHSVQRKTAAFRGLTKGLTHLDRVLSWTALTFVVLTVAATVLRIKDRTHYRAERVAVAGSQLVAYAGLGLIFVMWTNRKNPKLRKTVGIVWDLLTFWPRRFHPFAVTPYAEQAVPELRGRILCLRAGCERLLLSTHSQGTIITLAAVAPLVDHAAPNGVPITMITFGSPIGGLYQMGFPAYFTPELTDMVHARIEHWRNFRRLTDPIASEINSVPSIWLDSPGVTPSSGAALVVPATLAERDRSPWFCVETHSNYRNEPLLKEILDQLRQ